MTYDHHQRRHGTARQRQRGPYPPPTVRTTGQRPRTRQPSPPAARRTPQSAGTRRQFGRVDPFCWIAAGPLFIVGVGLSVIAGNVWIGVVGVAFSLALVLVDARVNRPKSP